MAFRKRNIALSRTPEASLDPSSPSSPLPSQGVAPLAHSSPQPAPSIPGVRPSPIDGRATTSTGTASLDAILAGHAGLPLGNSIFIGESGTTDYAGTLLRFCAAEGVVQGHKVHVVGVGEGWGRDLPGLHEGREEQKEKKAKEAQERTEKMKIAWRYEGLGEHGVARGSSTSSSGQEESVFCHTFDLAKRLTLPVGTAINYIAIPPPSKSSSFVSVLESLQQHLASSPPNSIHRLVIPSLLSPALYPQFASQPQHVLQFLHGLRALLRKYPARLTAMITIPLTLYPRSTGLVGWMEHFSDGVLELSPFPYDPIQALATSAGATKDEERPQGMLAVHKLPVFHEKGGGGAGLGDAGEDLAFTVSRRKFTIAKFSLPPVEGDTEAQQGAAHDAGGGTMPKKEDLEF
ncbi:Elongator complex protein 4 [Lophiotrema nucula]|uniref:Elongator complex protein 4 n=1 Tax=Lophiotrema nucula TaxID=690887 RepID=A0A6A5ZR82_9PLEO|nr:Elongator complex protein 4 [Lophiotrema nucula]